MAHEIGISYNKINNPKYIIVPAIFPLAGSFVGVSSTSMVMYSEHMPTVEAMSFQLPP